MSETCTFNIIFHHLSLNVIFITFSARGCQPGKTVNMTESEVRGLCIKSREIFLSQPILLELEAPLKICGMYKMISDLKLNNTKLDRAFI